MSGKYKPVVLSLFTGIGGLDIAFEKAGFNIVATIEWDKDCCDTLNLNKKEFLGKNTKIIQADITRITPEEIYSGDVDFFIGGPPCQTFSAIGRRAGGVSGRMDDRGNLFQHYCRLLKHYKPRGFMFENVRGILSSNGGKDWEDIRKEFSKLGYKLKYRVLDTAGYGAAQHRERVILVGYRDEEFFFPKPTHGPDSLAKIPYVGAAKAVNGVNHTEDVSMLFQNGGKYDRLLKDIPPGMNYHFYTEELGHPEPCFAWRSKFSDFLYKAHPDHPVKTIVASMGRYSGPFHWESRKLSIGELLRLQGFPDGYELSGGRTSKIRQIGNAVVPLFAFPLALAVKQTIFGVKSAKTELIKDHEVLSIENRKTVKAAITRSGRLLRSAPNQLALFNRMHDRPSPSVMLKSVKYSISYTNPSFLKLENPLKGEGEFTLAIQFKKEEAIVRLRKNNQLLDTNLNIEIGISSESVGLSRIKLQSNWYDPQRPYVLWDALNIVVSNTSHFSSIHELYGHFTEPNPKFSINEFRLPRANDPMTKLLKWMAVFGNTFETHPLSLLSDMGFGAYNERELLRTLRAKRIDLRTNLTNKRIKKGSFRICYPYTLPVDRKTFVTIN